MAGEENISREERMVKYHLLNRDTVIAEFVVVLFISLSEPKSPVFLQIK